MLVYGIKLYFTDGDWAYYYGKFDGSITAGKAECSIRCFETSEEVHQEWNEIKRMRWCDADGRTKELDINKCSYVRVNY